MPVATDISTLVDTLSTMSEFSIGLAGFSGVAAAVMQRSGKVAELDRIRITFNICMSLLPGFVAFLALSLINAGTEDALVIRSASGAMVVVYLAMLSLAPTLRRKAGGYERYNPFALGIFVLTVCVNLPLQIYNCVALPEAASGVLAAGLTMLLLAGAANFAGLLWQMLGYRAD